MIRGIHQLVFFFIASILPIHVLFAQSDSTIASEEDEEDSIVYIYEDPVFIKKTVEQKQDVFKNWFAEFSGSIFNYGNDHLLCSQFQNYKNTIQQCTKPMGGYSLGGSLIYTPKNISYSLGASYSSYLEHFSKTNDTIVKGINQYNYVDISGGMGIWLLRKHKYVSFMLNGSLMLSRLVYSNGNTIDYTDLTKVISDKSAGRDANWVGSSRFGLKIILLNNKPIKIYIEPYTRVNFTSVLNYKDNYYLRRWAYGLQAGIIYTF